MLVSTLRDATSLGPLLAIAALMAAPPASAHAALGGPVASVETDRAVMQGSRSIATVRSYSVHELKAPSGTVVREFVSADGMVFAVAWQGAFMPNLRLLLGDYFEAFSRAAEEQRAHRPGRRPVLVRGPGFVVESGGRMRALLGRAYLPERVPADLDEEGIR